MELLAPPEAVYARVYVDQTVSPLFIFSLKRKEERGKRKTKEKEDTERGMRKEERLGIREILTRGGSRRHRRHAGTSEEWQGDCLGIGKYENINIASTENRTSQNHKMKKKVSDYYSRRKC